MSVSLIARHLPSIASPLQILSNVRGLAITGVALAALYNLPTASAGPITYWSCVIGCEAMAPPFIPVCIAACLPLLAAPCP